MSSAAHAGLLALALALSRGEDRPETGDRADRRASERRQVEMVYLAPPPEPPPPRPPPPPSRAQPAPLPPPSRPAAPRPAREQPDPEPEPNAPPEAVPSEGEESPEPEVGDGAGPAGATPTLESEARRIFGRPRLATPSGAGPQRVRPMEAYIPDDPTKCVPREAAPRDSGEVQVGTVEGRILRGDTGLPLDGAHLHMIGTPYTAFTDPDGGYRFRFDLSLVDNCRTQYVRVTAQGYESRLLVLVVGPSVRSEDVHMKKRGWW